MRCKAILAVALLPGLLPECVFHTDAHALEPRHMRPRTQSGHRLVLSGRRLKELPLNGSEDPSHVHSAGNSSAVLREVCCYPVIDQDQAVNEVFDGEHLQALLEEEVTGTVHVEFAVRAVQVPAGDLANPNSAAIDCKGGYIDLRGVRVEGAIEQVVCYPVPCITRGKLCPSL